MLCAQCVFVKMPTEWKLIVETFLYFKKFLHLLHHNKILTNTTMTHKSFILTCLLAVLTIAVSAQDVQDMTQYITNPSFESGTNGWTARQFVVSVEQ